LGISVAAPGDYENGLISALNFPLKNNFPLKTELKEMFGLEIDVLHDGSAAVMGETSLYGTLPTEPDAMVVILASGISAGIKIEGKVSYGKGALQEIGLNLWFKKDGSGYEYLDDSSYEEHVNRKDNLLAKDRASLEKRLSGYNIGRRFVEYIKNKEGINSDIYLQGNSEELLKKLENKEAEATLKTLELITKKAQEPGLARDFVKEAGRELGTALSVFLAEHKDEKFTRHIVLVGGVAETFGLGVTNEDGSDFWLNEVREGVYEGLIHSEVKRDLATVISKGILRSVRNLDREFFGFLSQQKDTEGGSGDKKDSLPPFSANTGYRAFFDETRGTPSPGLYGMPLDIFNALKRTKNKLVADVYHDRGMQLMVKDKIKPIKLLLDKLQKNEALNFQSAAILDLLYYVVEHQKQKSLTQSTVINVLKALMNQPILSTIVNEKAVGQRIADSILQQDWASLESLLGEQTEFKFEFVPPNQIKKAA